MFNPDLLEDRDPDAPLEYASPSPKKPIGDPSASITYLRVETSDRVSVDGCIFLAQLVREFFRRTATGACDVLKFHCCVDLTADLDKIPTDNAAKFNNSPGTLLALTKPYVNAVEQVTPSKLRSAEAAFDSI